MNTQEKKEVILRIEYFISHYLPWILLLFLIAGISICIFHYKNKSCMFEEEEKEEEKVGDNLLEYKYSSLNENV
jgi:hypothetical protein